MKSCFSRHRPFRFSFWFFFHFYEFNPCLNTNLVIASQSCLFLHLQILFDHFHFLFNHHSVMNLFMDLVRTQPFELRKEWFYENLGKFLREEFPVKPEGNASTTHSRYFFPWSLPAVAISGNDDGVSAHISSLLNYSQSFPNRWSIRYMEDQSELECEIAFPVMVEIGQIIKIAQKIHSFIVHQQTSKDLRIHSASIEGTLSKHHAVYLQMPWSTMQNLCVYWFYRFETTSILPLSSWCPWSHLAAKLVQ